MIRPYPRYAELHARRVQPDTFTTDDLRDLQLLHKLVWMDPDWLRTDARLVALVAKQRGYDEEDKRRAARRRARTAATRSFRPIGGRRDGTNRAVDVAVLSPDPAAPVRHRRASARPSTLTAAATNLFVRPGDATLATAPRASTFTRQRSGAGRTVSGRQRVRSRTR